MTATEINALAARVVMDRLLGFKVTGSDSKGRVSIGRVLAPTAAELAWDAHLATFRAPRAPRSLATCIPASTPWR